LISKGLEVKITNMCAAHLLDHDHHQQNSPRSSIFGAEDFMPPEVLVKYLNITKYEKKIVIWVHHAAYIIPAPAVIDPNETPKSEIERRAKHQCEQFMYN